MGYLRSVMVLILVAGSTQAEDWPGWLGPRRDGSTTAKVAPWKGELKVLWKKSVGPGHSSPIVADGKVFLHTRVKAKGQEAEEVTAFDPKSGEEIWSKSYPRSKFSSPFGTGPQSTPVVSGEKLFSFGATGLLTCFDTAKGKQLWQVNTLKDFEATNLFFGAACSPLVDGDNVVVNVGGKGASVVAFAKDTGKVVWKNLDDKASYSSGISHGKGNDRQYIFLTQQGVRGFAPKDGTKLWDFPLKDKLNESSTTPVFAEGMLLASSVTFGMVGLKLEQDQSNWSVKQVWKNPRLTCYFSTPMPVGNTHVYVVSGQATVFNPTSNLHCVEVATGKIVWTQTKVGKYHAALTRTADNKLLMLSDLGELLLIDPSPKGFTELARTKFKTSEQIWAHPAISNGKLYYRDERELFCLQLPE